MKKRDYILVFNDWKEWTLKNKKTPRKLSDNEYESKLCTDMQGIIVILRKYPEAYNEIIYEYNNLIDMYGGRRSKKQRLQEWEEWIITNKKVPRPTSKDREEARIANITSQIIKKMRRNPELYSEELMRYKVVKGIYLKKGRGKENVLKTFREWKNFADSNGYIPKSNSSDDNERKIANNFYYTLKRMRNNPSLYKEELEEYSKILHASKPKSLKHKYKQEFLKHKEWIIANSKFPKQTSEDISERRLAGRMERIFRILKNDPDSFKQEIFELELLYKQYKKTSARDVEQIFKKWKEWCEKNKRTPKYTAVNREEVALYRQIYNALIRMRENPTYYSLCLQEYDEIYNKYNGDVYESYYEAFNEWKKWVEANNKIPRNNSCDEKEARISNKMWYIISRLNKQSYDYNNILSEHKEICGKIKEQRKRERVRKNFNSWQVWCIANKRLPKASSEDKYEEHLYHQMCRDLKFIKQDFENCSDILKEYEKLICEYKISIR